MEKIILKLGGQNCHLEIVKRDDGSKYVSFYGVPGYGYPSLEEFELEKVFKKVKKL